MRTLLISMRVTRRFAVDRHLLDGLDDRQAIDDAAERRVFAVENRARAEDDEERRVGAGRIVAASHRHRAFHVRRVVELGLQVAHEALLRLRQRLASRRQIARLNDEPFGDAVNAHAVVDAGLREPQKVAHVLRRLVRRELQRDVAHAGLEHGAVRAQLCGALGRERLGPCGRLVANRHRPDRDALFRAALLVRRDLGNLLRDENALADAAEHVVRRRRGRADRRRR